MKKLGLFCIITAFLVVGVLPGYPQTSIDLDQLSADEEFSWGVRSYNRGMFNEAARSFEKALGYKPDNKKAKEWLGNSWYRSGFTDAAVDLWEEIIDEGSADSLLINRYELIKRQIRLGTETENLIRYLPVVRLEGIREDYTLFRRPVAVYPGRDGDYYISAYGTNEILRFNTNGAVVNRFNGGLEGFNHPFGVLQSGDGNLYISEFRGDRIALCSESGRIIKRFGETGLGPSGLLGPQYLAADRDGYIYVSDSGNRRIVKFNAQGEYVLDFGRRSYDFGGFIQPTGLAVLDNRVYAADSERRDISIFDRSGNLLDTVESELLSSPEGLSVTESGGILIADAGRVLNLDPEERHITLVSEVENAQRLTSAGMDSNGNIITVDFDSDRVTVLSEMTSMYTGLHVQIDRINSNAFPDIIVDVRVTDRDGEPFVGLEPNNFVLTENGYSVSEPKLVYKGNGDERMEIALLLDGKTEMASHSKDVVKAVMDLQSAVAERGQIKVVSAGSSPVMEIETLTGEQKIKEVAESDLIYSDNARFDLGLRLAASELLQYRSRKAVIFITDGDSPPHFFTDYHPVDLASYLYNNGIFFYCISLGNSREVSEELSFLAEKTGGGILHLYHPEGISSLPDEILKKESGAYTIRYRSAGGKNYRDKFIPVEVEAFLFNRSGRESSGYYIPPGF